MTKVLTYEEKLDPYVWGFGNCEHHHIQTAILWKNTKISDQIKNFVIEQDGRASLFNMIKIATIIRDDEIGKKFFEQFLRLCELLVNA